MGGKVGWLFVGTLSEEIMGVWYLCCNADPFIILQTMILQRAQNVTGMQEIRQKITKRLDAGEVG